jgi:hypothetical protein
MRTPLVWNTLDQPYNDHLKKPNVNEYVIDLQSKLESIYRSILDVQNKARKSSDDRQKEIKQARPLDVGAIVVARIFPVIKNILQPRFEGPYKVVGKLGQWTYKLQHLETKAHIDRNHHHVKPCQISTDIMSRSKGLELSLEKNFSQEQSQLSQRKRSVQPPQRYGFSGRRDV